VAAHPSRARRAVRQLHGLGIDMFDVVVDPEPDGAPSAIRTYTRALAAVPADRHALILQDDAIPHHDVVHHADLIVRRHSTALVALYVGSIHAVGHAMRHDAARGRRFVTLPLRHFVPTVALIWPPGAPARFLDWLAANPRPDDRYQDDEVVKEWRCAMGREPIHAYAAIPSLVRHDNTLPSLLNHGHHGVRDALIPWDAWTGARPWEDMSW
jgi:hypothetical protein